MMKGSGELGLRMNNFYVEMNSSLMHTMDIPNRFVKMFLGSMSENIVVEGPSGYTWQVKIMRSDNTFTLQSGWKEFVTANKIYANDILVFTYKDNTSFKVLIFDRSGCEKVSPFFAKNMNTEPKTELEESNNSSTQGNISLPHRVVEKEIISPSSGSSDTDELFCEISARTPPVPTTGEKVCGKRKQRAEPTINSKTLHQKARKSMKNDSDELKESKNSFIQEIAAPHRKVKLETISLSAGTSDTDESSRKISACAARACMTGESVLCKRKQKDNVQESIENESKAGKNNRAMKDLRIYRVPFGTHLTPAQEEIANRMAQKTQKGSLLLVKILTTTNTTSKDCVLRLPDSYACKVLESKKKKITLLPADLNKRSKTCIANYYKKKNGKHIGQGWHTFVCANGLKQGDLCLFELRKKERRGNLTMVVHFNNK